MTASPTPQPLDLHTRGGRLSADIQAVVAADFIRNLREETKKGMYGRLKQGLYPLAAPLGYLDRGPGIPKEIDPLRGRMVRHLFELYASGNQSLDSLVEESRRIGLVKRNGKPLSRSPISRMLKNPFYTGIVCMGPSGESYRGQHTPLISVRLFETMQDLLRGRVRRVSITHPFLFRGLFACGTCEHLLTGEAQKGHVYYRCHNRRCIDRASAREETVEEAVRGLLARLTPTETEAEILRRVVAYLHRDSAEFRRAKRDQLLLRLRQEKDRLDRLLNSHLEGLIENAIFREKKAVLLSEITRIENDLAELSSKTADSASKLEKCFELAQTALLTYGSGNSDEKRRMVEIVSSNRRVFGKNVVVEPSNTFQLFLDRPSVPSRVLDRDPVRTLVEWFMSKEGIMCDLKMRELGL